MQFSNFALASCVRTNVDTVKMSVQCAIDDAPYVIEVDAVMQDDFSIFAFNNIKSGEFSGDELKDIFEKVRQFCLGIINALK